MTEFDYLNYKPDFKRDEKEFTGWQDEEDTSTRLEDEEGNLEPELEILPVIKDYEKVKEEINQRVEELEKKLPVITIEENSFLEKAFEELDINYTSTFKPVDYRDIFKEKESGPGKYIVDAVEEWIEGVDGDPEWEEYTEYLEIEEEIDVLDDYIDKIIYPIIDFEKEAIDYFDYLEEKEREWRQRAEAARLAYERAMNEYTKSLYSQPKEIPSKRDRVYNSEREDRRYRQERNQIDISLKTVRDKSNLLSQYNISLPLANSYHPPRDVVANDLLRLTQTEKEREETLRVNILMLKQTVDDENNNKRDYKDTRRNIYSENKQRRIINEYSTVNELYRKSVLPNVHYIRGFQDQTTTHNDETYNQAAKSLLSNHLENREKAYESYLIQISTSQTRLKRLECMSNKNKSRVLYNHLYNTYYEWYLKVGEEEEDE